VGFKVGADTSNLTASVTYTPGAANPNGKFTTISVNPSDPKVGDTANITVVLKDDFDNPITNASVVILVADGGYIKTYGNLSATTNQGGGIYTANISSDAARNATLGFTVAGTTSNKSADVSFTATACDAGLTPMACQFAANIMEPFVGVDQIEQRSANEFEKSITYSVPLTIFTQIIDSNLSANFTRNSNSSGGVTYYTYTPNANLNIANYGLEEVKVTADVSTLDNKANVTFKLTSTSLIDSALLDTIFGFDIYGDLIIDTRYIIGYWYIDSMTGVANETTESYNAYLPKVISDGVFAIADCRALAAYTTPTTEYNYAACSANSSDGYRYELEMTDYTGGSAVTARPREFYDTIRWSRLK
jgi:hypothetical protein